MFALTNEVRRYAWGSHTAMAEFLGRAGPSDEPEAEFWIGAYSGLPSRLPDGRPLSELIASDPVGTLGADGVARFGPRLPFLMKVLTIGSPLSLQAHPNATQAEEGFAAEEAAGVGIEDPSRNYKDRGHKPEMLCALTPVEAFCGFRAAPDAVALLEELGIPDLAGLQKSLTEAGLEPSVRWIFDLPDDDVATIVAALATATVGAEPGPYDPALQWTSRLAEAYPGDQGVVLTLLCEFIALQPGQALAIPAGCLHGYLSGMGVEIMAESDNVLRGGLTAKHVDAVDLQRVLDFTGAGARVIDGEDNGDGATRFPTDADEFELSRREVTEPITLREGRPTLLLTVDGTARLTGQDGAVLDLPRGAAAFVAAGENGVQLSGPAVVFEASTGISSREAAGDPT